MTFGIALLVVALASLTIGIVVLVAGRGQSSVDARLQSVREGTPRTAGPGPFSAAGRVTPPTAPSQAEVEGARKARAQVNAPTLRDRLVQAGLYRAYSPQAFFVLRVLLAAIPIGLGVAAGMTGRTSLIIGLLVGGVLSGLGTIAPSFWLDFMKTGRQRKIRRALPDALDVIVVCMDGGLSLTGAFARVAQELASAHPLLSLELRIVQREVQMGRSTGEALRSFAKRFDVEELRSLAAVISQSERFGTSIVQALTVYSETMRVRRYQNAETLAHQASIKMIFPTLFCIFPAIFIVILGPAAIKIYENMFAPGGAFNS